MIARGMTFQFFLQFSSTFSFFFHVFFFLFFFINFIIPSGSLSLPSSEPPPSPHVRFDRPHRDHTVPFNDREEETEVFVRVPKSHESRNDARRKYPEGGELSRLDYDVPMIYNRGFLG